MKFCTKFACICWVLQTSSFLLPVIFANPTHRKSSLLKSILGELDLRTGELYVRTPRVGYCDSNPWIPNGTIRSCVVGTGDLDYDSSWYDEVVHACALDEDIRSLADGSSTELGSRGIALSEGQKQRLVDTPIFLLHIFELTTTEGRHLQERFFLAHPYCSWTMCSDHLIQGPKCFCLRDFSHLLDCSKDAI